MQAASDIMLGWSSTVGLDDVSRDFYMRQLWDWKVSANMETMPPTSFHGLRARSAAGRWPGPTPAPGDAIAIGAYLGSGDTFDRAMGAFARAYADQNERDHGPWSRPSPAAAWRRRPVSEPPAPAAGGAALREVDDDGRALQRVFANRYLIRFEENTLRQRPLCIRVIVEFVGTFVLVTVAAGSGVINHYVGATRSAARRPWWRRARW